MGSMVVIGVGITVFLLMFFSTIVDKEKHKHIRTFFLLVSLPLLFLIPASLTLDKEVCEVVLDNSTVVSNTTSYDYSTYCYSNEDGSKTFIRAFSIILVVFMIYIAFIFFADIIAWLRSIIKKV